MNNKLSAMEMTEKVLEIIQKSYAVQQTFLRSELYSLFREYEINKKDKDKDIYNEGLL